MGDRALTRLGIASVSASLVSFKGKFQPRWEARYIVAEKASDWPALGVATLFLHYPELEQRVHRFVPQLSWRRQTRVAAALAGALLAAGTSGILVAAAQSHEGHPLYQARLAANYVGTVLPPTGPKQPSRSRDHSVTAPPEHGMHSRRRLHPHVRPKFLFERQAPSPAPAPPRQRQ
jgi:lysylphosphatidylglycerol synthetase-like protein (DUF2156 family)